MTSKRVLWATILGCIGALVLAVAFAVPRPASVPPEGLRRTEETPSGESSAQNDCDEHAVAHAQKPTTPEVWQEEGTPDEAAEEAPEAEGPEENPEYEEPITPLFTMPEGAEYVPQEAVVQIPEDADLEGLSAELSEWVGPVSLEEVASGFARVSLPEDVDVADAVNALLSSGIVEEAQPNYVYHLLSEEDATQADDARHEPEKASEEDEAPADATVDEEPSAQEPPSPTDLPEAQEGEPVSNDEDNASAPSEEEQPTKTDSSLSSQSVEKKDEGPDAEQPEKPEKPEEPDIEPQSTSINDPYASSQWALKSMRAYDAWDYAKCNKGVAVAVLDVGFSVNHPDLKANLVDAYNAYNAVNGGPANDVASNEHEFEHGTHVAGIISGVANNKVGIAGVSYNANIIPVKVTGSAGTAVTTVLVKAYDYVMSRRNARNVRVINLSMGADIRNLSHSTFGSDDALLKKINQATNSGIVTVVAAGNRDSSKDYTIPFDCYPADSNEVVAVVSLDQTASGVTRAASSNYNANGQTTKNISAPGVDVLSTNLSNDYDYSSGTSMAAPNVAGVLALEFAANPSLSSTDAVATLYATATDLEGSEWTNEYGWGAVDAAAAAKAARNGLTAAQKTKSDHVRASMEGVGGGSSTHKTLGVAYRTHVQREGWQTWKTNGVTSGTTGKSLRLEGINVKLQNNPYAGSIEYRTHVQSYGWESAWKRDGQTSGTQGQSKRLEAIQMRLTSTMAQAYDVWYRVHAQQFGWMGWAKNGDPAGTAGYSYRLEGIQVKLLPKGSAAPGSTSRPFRFAVRYRTHVQRVGWQPYVRDGATSGTTGQSLRLEGINVTANGSPYSGSIRYRTHVQTYGWREWATNGALSGTQGQSKRLEAIRIELTGELATHFDVYYRVHAQRFGWMGWAKNGASAGTEGYSYRLEGIQIRLVAKGAAAPGSTSGAFARR